MNDWLLNVFLYDPLALFTGNETDPEKVQLLRIIAFLVIFLGIFIIRDAWKFFQDQGPLGRHFRFLSKVKLEVTLEKDRLFRPQVLTLTISNIGKYEADLNAPVIEFRKIWSKRRFKLNGIKGHQVYPMYLNPGLTHELEIETATFHQYDRTIKKFYWARVYVSDIKGYSWKSNKVKLRKSLVT